MLFPLRTDRRLTRIPWVNLTLIALNVIVFLVTYQQVRAFGQAGVLPPVAQFYLWPGSPQVFQFLSYQFLHGDWMHLLGNMLFLYVFGNSVEDRLGRGGYLLFYLSAGVMAGLGHVWAEQMPVIGASGSVAGVTGAFLALFPLSRVIVVLVLPVIIPFEVTGVIVIGFQIGVNVVMHALDAGGNVAYLAHLAGYAHGFAIGMGLLLVRLLPREPYDMLALIERRRRRHQFRRMARAGYQPWESPGPADAATEPPAQMAGPLGAEQQRLMQQRSRVSHALASHDLPGAAQRYREMLLEHPDQVMSQQQQLDLANQLMADGHHGDAARAYELFLEHYPAYPEREQVQLILGLLHARYLGDTGRARELLRAAAPRLAGSNRQLAEQLLADLE